MCILNEMFAEWLACGSTPAVTYASVMYMIMYQVYDVYVSHSDLLMTPGWALVQ